jgi:hypothetical protein
MSCPPNTTLPNPRLVSNVYCRDVNATSNRTNQFFTIFSQFVDHDFTLTLDHGTVACCQKPNDPTCINVIVPPNDTQRHRCTQEKRGGRTGREGEGYEIAPPCKFLKNLLIK